MSIDWSTIRGKGAGALINSGIYIGPTQGLSSPKNDRRSCLCTNSNTYSRKCCNGNLIAQGIGVIQGIQIHNGGSFNDGFSDGFNIGSVLNP
tara:strand:+ start:216 stop:491 length:276 start_codon:yes stop_codon:yes gene_type:complete